jgi:hypothetical protein
MKKALVLGAVGPALLFVGCSENTASGGSGSGGTIASGGSSGDGPGGRDPATGGAGGTGGSTTRADAEPDLQPPDSAGSDGPRPGDAGANDSGAASCDPTAQISSSYLVTKLSELSGESPVIIDGQSQTIKERYTTASKQLARAYLRKEYEALGFTVTEHKYATGTNLIAQKKGAEDKIVMFSGHYDSASASVPGADDDGTGVVGGLAIARALAGCALDRELRIVAFDEEELGMKGSTAYVSQLAASGEAAKLNGNIVMEMYGYDKNDDGGFLVLDCSTVPGTTVLVDALKSAISDGKLPLVVKNGPACESGSDHDPFWARKLPAIVFSEEFFIANADTNPCYHQSCDRVDQINSDYMAKLTMMAARAAAKLAGAH